MQPSASVICASIWGSVAMFSEQGGVHAVVSFHNSWAADYIAIGSKTPAGGITRVFCWAGVAGVPWSAIGESGFAEVRQENQFVGNALCAA